ncbi:hypothetical protein DFQ28_005063 [Apophysomyces sp. BC1034]|nr:hypothetical protein DFQ30_002758 [Apophysomyces sp. BC1015]KAG0183022.1 hypothetical protein DFQ29_000443 [Apophysomyces sp. BC1021]KAG0194850.1 hypothetical protein DFQ28_005063 [Apophysomyces sp. BC1034]
MSSSLPLSGLVVFEFAGLAPAPFAGLILSDFGANVIRIDRTQTTSVDTLCRNKRSIALDLKNPASVETLKRMLKQADVLLDPYRPGIMEKMGLGPEVLLAENPRLIFARLSGYGQTGSASQAAGHDLFRRPGEVPSFPLNIMADFAGGGLMCVMGILMAIIERSRSGKGQVVDAGLTAGTSYLATFPYTLMKVGLVHKDQPGTNMLDGGSHFYQIYETKDGRYMAVGSIEPHFYALALEGLGLAGQADLPDQMDRTQWPAMKQRFAAVFATKTQAEWTKIFDGSDACVTPVLAYREPIPGTEGDPEVSANQWPRQASVPQPAPILSRTPAPQAVHADNPFLLPGKHTVEILTQFGIERDHIQKLLTSGVAEDDAFHSNL